MIQENGNQSRQMDTSPSKSLPSQTTGMKENQKMVTIKMRQILIQTLTPNPKLGKVEKFRIAKKELQEVLKTNLVMGMLQTKSLIPIRKVTRIVLIGQMTNHRPMMLKIHWVKAIVVILMDKKLS